MLMRMQIMRMYCGLLLALYIVQPNRHERNEARICFIASMLTFNLFAPADGQIILRALLEKAS